MEEHHGRYLVPIEQIAQLGSTAQSDVSHNSSSLINFNVRHIKNENCSNL